MKLHIMELNFIRPRVISSFLVEAGGEPFLIETGPDTTYENLKSELKKRGYSPGDLKKVFVTHIHLDHSGAAWHLAKEGATIFVHPKGARHLADPTKLLASARMIYGEQMEELWGRVEPIAEDSIHALSDGEAVRVGDVEVRAVETLGHASHHHAYVVEGHAFLGDIGGICIEDGPPLPPTPPPDINVEAWRDSLGKLREYSPVVLHPTHFAQINRNLEDHFADLESRLLEFTDWIGERLREGKTEEEIISEYERLLRGILARANVTPDIVKSYELADPFWMNVGGLVRYWKKFRL